MVTSVFNLLRGAGVTVTIQPEHQAYMAGAVIHVSGEIRAERDTRINGVNAELQCDLRYRYRTTTNNNNGNSTTVRTTTDSKTCDVVPVKGPGMLQAGVTIPFQADIHIPMDALPGSGHGEATTVTWRVRGAVNIPRAPDAHNDATIIMLAPKDDYIHRAYLPAGTNTDICDLAIDVPDRSVLAGTELQGQLHIVPRDGFSARSIKIDLIRQERVSRDRGYQTSQVVMSTPVQPPDQGRFEPGRQYDLPFRILVPSGGSAYPGHDTPRTSVRWYLQATLDRRLRSNPEMTMELNIYTAPEDWPGLSAYRTARNAALAARDGSD